MDALLVSEPNINKANEAGWTMDVQGKTALVVTSDRHPSTLGRGEGYTWADMGNTRLFSCYAPPNDGCKEFSGYLQKLSTSMAQTRKDIVIGGDLNAKSTAWGGKRTDKRGEILLEWLAEEQCTPVNEGGAATFIGRGEGSVIDLTVRRDNNTGTVESWRVMEEESLSDHRYIRFNIRRGMTNEESESPTANTPRWNVRSLRAKTLAESFRRAYDAHAGGRMEALNAALEVACGKAMKKKSEKRRAVYWWNQSIADKRRECLATRRRYTRARGEDREVVKQELQNKRKELQNRIRRSKKKKWQGILNDVKNDIWGQGYAIVTRALRAYRRTPPMPVENQRRIAEALFPRGEEHGWSLQDGEAENITEAEVKRAGRKLAKKKAPGPDGVPAEAVKILAHREAPRLAEALSEAMRRGTWPTSWKSAKLVLIPKGTEDKYRPICLINTIAKLFEQIIVERATAELAAGDGISRRQYGFIKGRSTQDPLKTVVRTAALARDGTRRKRKLCALLTIDVKNAFNSAPWRGIMEALHRKGMSAGLMRIVANYLSDRTIKMEDGQETAAMDVNREVPQGSVLGPLLWNCFYDGVLRLTLPRGVTSLAYADDLALVGVTKTIDDMKAILSTSVNKVQNWMAAAGLQIAPEKSELVVFSGRRKIQSLSLRVGGVDVTAEKTMKYLGVILDKSLTFRDHLQKGKEKAHRMMGALGRLMYNRKGPNTQKRRVLAAAAASKVLYAAGTWLGALNIKANQALLVKAQRPAAIKVARCYRTTSTDAALVVGGMIPLHLQARARARSGTRAQKKMDTMEEWQREWATGTKGGWTRAMIPDIRPWVSRQHGEVEHHLAQVLTGHGCFQAYLNRIGRKPTDRCRTCDTTEDAAHVLFDCARWEDIRPGQLKDIQEHREREVVRMMLQDARNWDAVQNFVTEAITTLEREDGCATATIEDTTEQEAGVD